LQVGKVALHTMVVAVVALAELVQGLLIVPTVVQEFLIQF
jgi:hypothetical protein